MPSIGESTNMLSLTHTHTHSRALHYSASPLRRRHLMFVTSRAGQIKGRNEIWAVFFFFLISWKERREKSTKLLILQAVKLASSWIRGRGRNWAPKAATLTSVDGWVWSDVHAFTLLLLGRWCYTAAHLCGAAFHKTVLILKANVNQLHVNNLANSYNQFLTHLIWECRGKEKQLDRICYLDVKVKGQSSTMFREAVFWSFEWCWSYSSQHLYELLKASYHLLLLPYIF